MAGGRVRFVDFSASDLVPFLISFEMFVRFGQVLPYLARAFNLFPLLESFVDKTIAVEFQKVLRKEGIHQVIDVALLGVSETEHVAGKASISLDDATRVWKKTKEYKYACLGDFVGLGKREISHGQLHVISIYYVFVLTFDVLVFRAPVLQVAFMAPGVCVICLGPHGFIDFSSNCLSGVVSLLTHWAGLMTLWESIALTGTFGAGDWVVFQVLVLLGSLARGRFLRRSRVQGLRVHSLRLPPWQTK